MIIEISSSGGIAGLPAAGVSKRLVVDDKSDAQKAEICSAFDPKNLTKLADKATAEGAADTITYKIVVTDNDEEKHEFDIAEEALPAEMLDMIDDM